MASAEESGQLTDRVKDLTNRRIPNGGQVFTKMSGSPIEEQQLKWEGFYPPIEYKGLVVRRSETGRVV